MTSQEFMNAGQASRKSSRSHPGRDLKLTGRRIGPGLGGAAAGASGGLAGGALTQPAKPMTRETAQASTLVRPTNLEREDMWLVLLEAGVAMFLLIFIVWWTMFSGRKPDRPAARRPPENGDREA
jgi:hypothetical protein